MNIIKIDHRKKDGHVTISGSFYICDDCQSNEILSGYKYCPNCGVRIFWRGEDEIDEVECEEKHRILNDLSNIFFGKYKNYV